MKKVYLLLVSALVISLVSCGGEEKKKDSSAGSGTDNEEEETEEPAKEEPEVDYSYVLPQIDTAALGTEAEILTAMEKVVDARILDDSLANNVSGYSGYYTELTTLYSTVTNKATQYGSTLKAKEAIAFNEKLSAITEKMYAK